MKKENHSETNTHHMPIGMCLGLAIGTAIGAATDNLGTYMPIGLAIGMAIGSIVDNKQRKKGENDPEKKD